MLPKWIERRIILLAGGATIVLGLLEAHGVTEVPSAAWPLWSAAAFWIAGSE